MSIVTDYLDLPVRAQADNTLANAELVVNIIIIFFVFHACMVTSGQVVLST